MTAALADFWSVPEPVLLDALAAKPDGLSGPQAADRLARGGPNVLGDPPRSDAATLLRRQLTLLTDLPELAIATDRVDRQWIDRPRRWDVGFIRRFMLTFGLISSIFDYLTFGVLLLVLDAGVDEFRTGWFVESVVSAALTVLVVRTRGSLLSGRPSRALLAATLLVVGATVAMPFTPLGGLFGFLRCPPPFWR